jgi:hypothetical protein
MTGVIDVVFKISFINIRVIGLFSF